MKVSPSPRFTTRAVIACLTTAACILSASLFVITFSVRQEVRRTTGDRLDASKRLLVALESRRVDSLRASIATLAENAALKTALDTYRLERAMGSTVERAQLAAAIGSEIQKAATQLDPDVLAVRADDGELVAMAGRRAGEWAAEYRGEAEGAHTSFLTLPSGVFRWMTAPVMLKDVRLGTIQVAQALDDRYASELSALSGVRTLVVSDGRPVASTLEDDVLAALTGETLQSLASTDRVILRTEEYAVRPLIHEDSTAVFVFDSIDAAARPLLRSWLKATIGVAFGALALAGLAGLWLGRTIADPIDAMARSLGEMARARRFTQPLAPSGASLELDKLTIALNGMMAAVRAGEQDTLRAYLEAVRALAVALDERDPHTAGHSQRVSILAAAIGRKMHLDDGTLEVLQLGALLHDVGKIGVSEELLSKPGPLSAEEYEAVKAHPTVGSRILQGVTFLAPHLPIIELHHERPDGSGYPHGLRGNDIPVLARIVHVADAYDAMTTARPYRAALRPADALRELQRCAGTDFDADVVKVLTVVLAEHVVFPSESRASTSSASASEHKPRNPGLREVKKPDPLEAFGSEEQSA